MGHMINPFSFRLGIIFFWKNTWVNTLFYKLLGYDFLFYDFCEFFFKKVKSKFYKVSLLFDFILINKQKKNLNLNIFFYVGIFEFFFYYIYLYFRHLKKIFRWYNYCYGYDILKKTEEIVKLDNIEKKERVVENLIINEDSILEEENQIKIDNENKNNISEKKIEKIESNLRTGLKEIDEQLINLEEEDLLDNEMVINIKKVTRLIENIIKILNFFYFMKKKYALLCCKFISFFFEKYCKYLNINFYKNLSFSYLQYNNFNYSSKIFNEFLCFKLKQKFVLSELIHSSLASIRNFETLGGFKIRYAGRFSRKDRTLRQVRFEHRLPYNSLKYFLDYSCNTIILKYSTCCIKIWFYWKHDLKTKVFKI